MKSARKTARRWGWGFGGAAVLFSMVRPGYAQEAKLSAVADVMAGIEGGGRGYAAGIRRSRTTLRLGVEGWVDEYPLHSAALAARIELEPYASFGADARYQLRALDEFVFHAGASLIMLPKHAIGGTFGFGWRPMLTESVGAYVGPTVEVFLLGADLPADTVVWQASAEGGVRVAF